jgi:glutamate-1-semialdehyde 2,1-aminomutase
LSDRTPTPPGFREVSGDGYFRPTVREESVRRKTPGSSQRYQRACRTLAGGVSSGLRRSARPYPLFFDHGEGTRVVDVDGNSYLDYGLAWGPLIAGHSHPKVVEAVQRQAARSMTFGAQHDLEYEVSELLCEVIPCADRVCFANSGTEIVQVALRLARAITGRKKYVKFEGHYHGWSDEALVAYHPRESDALERPAAVGAGQLPHDHVIIAEWNDCRHVERIFAEGGGEISAIICEPLLANSGCIPPAPGFLEFLREVSARHGALLIFDEVITGFRVDLRGAQGRWGVTPDLATYAKAVGGGVPLSVLAGRSEYMDWIARGEVVHAGTLNGNPLCLAAARATIELLAADHGSVYGALRKRADRLRAGIGEALQRCGFPVTLSGDGPVFSGLFHEASGSQLPANPPRANGALQRFCVGSLGPWRPGLAGWTLVYLDRAQRRRYRPDAGGRARGLFSGGARVRERARVASCVRGRSWRRHSRRPCSWPRKWLRRAHLPCPRKWTRPPEASDPSPQARWQEMPLPSSGSGTW